jgi:hypothetical protein
MILFIFPYILIPIALVAKRKKKYYRLIGTFPLCHLLLISLCKQFGILVSLLDEETGRKVLILLGIEANNLAKNQTVYFLCSFHLMS